MRVLMTGGYGCIGSWVAKQLVEAGREVWVFDLKEDTHRLDLLLDAEQRERVHFVRATSPSPTRSARRSRRVGATHLLHLAGLQTPTCRADPILGAKVNVIGTLAVFEAAVALEGAGRAGRLRQLGGRPRAGRARSATGRSATRSGSPRSRTTGRSRSATS